MKKVSICTKDTKQKNISKRRGRSKCAWLTSIKLRASFSIEHAALFRLHCPGLLSSLIYNNLLVLLSAHDGKEKKSFQSSSTNVSGWPTSASYVTSPDFQGSRPYRAVSLEVVPLRQHFLGGAADAHGGACFSAFRYLSECPFFSPFSSNPSLPLITSQDQRIFAAVCEQSPAKNRQRSQD